LANLGGLDSSGKSDPADKTNSVQGTVDRGNVLFNFAPRGASIQANDAAKSNTSASDMKAVPNAAGRCSKLSEQASYSLFREQTSFAFYHH
jgi:hypothetical protein